METRANFVLIGAFTLAVIGAAFLFVYWLAGAGQVSQRTLYRVVFTGSVSGLSRGGTVLFNGLHVGEVKSMDFVPNDPGRVAAIIQVEGRIPVKQDTKVRLELQGLTGAAAVALTGGAKDAPDVVGKNGEPPTLFAEPSQIQNLLENVQNISAKADAVLAKADRLLSDNGPAISDTLKNIDTFSKALGDSSSGMSGAMTGIADLGRKIGPLAQRLETLTADADKLLTAIDADKVKKSVNDINAFTGALGDKNGPLQSAFTDVATLAKRLNETSKGLDSAIADIDGLVKAVDPKKIANFAEGVDALGTTLRENKGNIDRAVKNASELTAKLNESADKVDGVLASAQSFLGSPDVKGPLGEVGDAAKSIRLLADQLNAKVKEISYGLARFTGPGLREYEGLAIDGRRTLNDIDRVVKSFERDPSQLIWGAKAKPDTPVKK